MRRCGRSHRRCCVMAPTPSPLTNTTSLAAESLTTSADHLPETTSTAAQIAAPRHQIAAVSLRWRDEIDAVSPAEPLLSLAERNGERQFLLHCGWQVGPGSSLGSKPTKRRPGPRSRTVEAGDFIAHTRVRSYGRGAADEKPVFSQLRRQDFPNK
jgi:hypothetical protein